MPIPQPSPTNPILYQERKVWVKGYDTGLVFDVDVAQFGGSAVALGQNDLAHSLPVALPTDQIVGVDTSELKYVAGVGKNAAVSSGLVTRAIGAGGTLTYGAIYSPPAATFTNIQLNRVECAILSNTVASDIYVHLRTISSAPTGGTNLTPHALDTTVSLPTVLCMVGAIAGGAASIGVINQKFARLGVTGAASVINPPPIANYFTLYTNEWFPFQPAPLSSAPATGRGWAITVNSSAASSVGIEFTFWFSEIA